MTIPAGLVILFGVTVATVRIFFLIVVGGGLQVGLTILSVILLGTLTGFPLNQALFFNFLIR